MTIRPWHRCQSTRAPVVMMPRIAKYKRGEVRTGRFLEPRTRRAYRLRNDKFYLGKS